MITKNRIEKLKERCLKKDIWMLNDFWIIIYIILYNVTYIMDVDFVPV